MNKKYLNKVVNQLESETIIDGNIVSTTFIPSFSSFFSSSPYTSFSEFVIEVYGLTEEEVKYVWKQYRYIIIMGWKRKEERKRK